MKNISIIQDGNDIVLVLHDLVDKIPMDRLYEEIGKIADHVEKAVTNAVPLESVIPTFDNVVIPSGEYKGMTPEELVDKYSSTSIPYDVLTGLLGTDSQLDIAIQHAVKKYMKIRFENTDPVEYANKIQGKQLNKFLEKFDYSIPVIVKNAGSKNIALMNRAANTGNKYMSMLSLLLAVPLFWEMPFVLGVWLKTVPEWAILFCRLQLVLTIISMTASNTTTSVYATGKIKYYAIYKSVMNLLPILFTFICFKLGGGPYWLYIPMFVFWGLGGNTVIVYFASKLCNLSLLDYLNEVLKPVLSTLVLMVCAGLIVTSLMPSGVLRFLVCSFATTTTMMLSMWIWWMSREEKNAFLTLINKRIRMHKAK